MNEIGTPVRVAGFLGVLGMVFAAALGVGAWAGPAGGNGDGAGAGAGEGAGSPSGEASTHGHGRGPEARPSATATPPPPAGESPGGLQTSENGYTLSLDRPTAEPGTEVPVGFTITGPDGRPVAAYDVTHEKELHLVAVRRDQTGFQHVHPRRTDGAWRTELDLTPGSWRLLADFAPTGGEPLTLGTDLAVAGDFEPASTPPVARVAEVDGYTVTLAGDLEPGADSELTLTVTRDGRPVTDLEPYLGASGHLVALRDGDLAYLHVHPHEGGAGPEVRFTAEVPSPGRYHLYLDFQHDGVVRTAAFPVAAADGDGTSPGTGAGRGAGHDEGAPHGH